MEKVKNLKPINFEKDNPEIGHLEFIHSLANLKAKSYKIPYCDKFYTLEYIGKIAPTTITSTAIVGGFMCFQMIGIIINQLFFWDKKKNLSKEYEDIDDEELIDNCLHNLSFNLLNNSFNIESLYGQIYKGIWKGNDLIPKYFSRWYKIVEKGNRTIEEFNDYIKEKYGIDVTLILSAEDDSVIYEKINIKKINKNSKRKKKWIKSKN